MNIYETTRLLNEYLLFHYGSEQEILPEPFRSFAPVTALHFAVRTVVENLPAQPVARALDLGCATGRSSFELSRFAHEVIGIDFSQTFVTAAETLRTKGSLDYQRHEEGELNTPLTARVPLQTHPQRVQFEHGDAQQLRADLGQFEIVHAANLLCRLPEPELLLRRFPNLVQKGGRLVLTTPCTWLGEFTPPERWPQGPTLAWLSQHLEGDFILEAVRDQPFLIREHARKYQWNVAQASVWRRRSE